MLAGLSGTDAWALYVSASSYRAVSPVLNRRDLNHSAARRGQYRITLNYVTALLLTSMLG